MPTSTFPPLSAADETGLLSIGGSLSVELLLSAYSNGIFPWPVSDRSLIPWFSPPKRGILRYDELHVNKSLKRSIKTSGFSITFNRDFESVIMETARHHSKNNNSTWLTKNMIKAYTELHHEHHAFSVEVWHRSNLCAGLYGVNINSFASGESMFYKKNNAGKIAVIALLNYLNLHGSGWLDIQMVTAASRSLGGREIEREIFMDLLKLAIARPNNLFDNAADIELDALQLI